MRIARSAFVAACARTGLRPMQLTIVGMMILAAAIVVLLVAGTEAADHQRAQRAWADRAAASLGDQVESAGAVLTATRGLFSASRSVTPEEFEVFARVELQESQMLSLNWAPRVPASGRGRYERATGYRIRPDVPRAAYYPLTLEAPRIPGTLSRLGLDVTVNPAVREGLDRARDSGRAEMTGVIARRPAGARAVALVAAVYGPDPRPPGPRGRRAHLRGFVGGTFDVRGMVAPALALLPDGSRLQVVSGATPVFDSGRGVLPHDAAVARVGTTDWTVRVALDRSAAAIVVSVLGPMLASAVVILLVAVLFRQANQRRRERQQARARLQHEADTDSLTGLANRRTLRRDLAEATARATVERPAALILLDLNGFKGYNDRFGHPAGDVLLQGLADRLAAAVPDGRVYRLGGDEFCVLAPVAAGEVAGMVGAAREGLSERGDDFAITAAHGVALAPDDGATPEQVMLVADHRMYARKALGRASAGRQSADVLLRAIAERSAGLGDHLEEVADLADAVARRLGLGEPDRGLVRRAALLHDVGKVAIPDSILRKPGPLDAAERAFIERHTVIGERILRAAPALEPVARLVRASHERWDGTGYPDGLAGEEIPLAARIIFACDAFEAMTSRERPYREARSVAGALAELRRCAGTQFDPRVVDELVAVVLAGEAGAADDPRAPAGALAQEVRR